MTGLRPLIGVVSGLGPLAGADVLRKLFEHAAVAHGARDDMDYPDVVLVSRGIAGFDNTGSILPGFEQELVSVVDDLERHHPTAIGIACNTAHLCRRAVLDHTRARFVDIIEATAAEAARHDLDYLLISSSTTRRTGLYRAALDRRHVRFTEVDEVGQVTIDRIVDLVMAFELQAAGTALAAFLREYRKRHPFNGIIAGCTELPLAIDNGGAQPGVAVVESNRVLANALADAALGVCRAAELRLETLAG